MALNLEVVIAVSVWIEALIYGIYVCLFFETLFIMLRRRGRMLPSAKFFLFIIVLMFLVATGHIVVNLYRFLRAFIIRVDPIGPLAYIFTFPRWDNMANLTMTSIMIWLGDILVIYRCYLIWNRKIWVTIIPIGLLLFSIGSNAALFFWFKHPLRPGSIPNSIRYLKTVYPISFSQNTFTTGMIALKIWRQHRASSIVGVVNGSPLRLIGILRIVIESALIYTLQQFVLVILYPLNSPFQYVIDGTVIPSIGIVFALIAVRVHASRERSLFPQSVVIQSVPAWLANSSTFNIENSNDDRRSTDVTLDQGGLIESEETKRALEAEISIAPPELPEKELNLRVGEQNV